MRNNSLISPNLNRKLDLSNMHYNKTHCSLNTNDDSVQNLGSEIEKKRLEMIVDLVEKRKKIRDISVNRIDDLIVYCDNKILALGTYYAIQIDTNLKKMADKWRQVIVDLEKMKIGENKELFKDTLFLRNEWIKSLLNYTEEKKLDEIMDKISCK